MTSGADIVVAAALTPEEQEGVFEQLHDIRLRQLAGEDSESAHLLRSLWRVAEVAGRVQTVDDHREIQPQLVRDGEEIAPLSQVLRRYESWRRAREAISRADVTTARRIEGRRGVLGVRAGREVR